MLIFHAKNDVTFLNDHSVSDSVAESVLSESEQWFFS